MNLFEKWVELQVQKLLLWKDKVYRKLTFDIDTVEKKRETIQDYSNDLVIETKKQKRKREKQEKKALHQSVHAKNVTNATIIQSGSGINIGMMDNPKVTIELEQHYGYSDDISISYTFYFDRIILTTSKHKLNSEIESKYVVISYDDIYSYGKAAYKDDLHYDPFILLNATKTKIKILIYETVHTSQTAPGNKQDVFAIGKKGSHTIDQEFKIPIEKKIENLFTDFKDTIRAKPMSGSMSTSITGFSMPTLKKKFDSTREVKTFKIKADTDRQRIFVLNYPELNLTNDTIKVVVDNLILNYGDDYHIVTTGNKPLICLKEEVSIYSTILFEVSRKPIKESKSPQVGLFTGSDRVNDMTIYEAIIKVIDSRGGLPDNLKHYEDYPKNVYTVTQMLSEAPEEMASIIEQAESLRGYENAKPVTALHHHPHQISNIVSDFLNDIPTKTFARTDVMVNIKLRPSSYSDIIKHIRKDTVFEIKDKRYQNGFYYVPSLSGWVEGRFITILSNYVEKVVPYKAMIRETSYVYDKNSSSQIKDLIKPGKVITVDFCKERMYNEKDIIYSPTLEGYVTYGKIRILIPADSKDERRFLISKDAKIFNLPHEDSGVLFYINKDDDVIGDIEIDDFIYLPHYEGWIDREYLLLSGRKEPVAPIITGDFKWL